MREGTKDRDGNTYRNMLGDKHIQKHVRRHFGDLGQMGRPIGHRRLGWHQWPGEACIVNRWPSFRRFRKIENRRKDKGSVRKGRFRQTELGQKTDLQLL